MLGSFGVVELQDAALSLYLVRYSSIIIKGTDVKDPLKADRIAPRVIKISNIIRDVIFFQILFLSVFEYEVCRKKLKRSS